MKFASSSPIAAGGSVFFWILLIPALLSAQSAGDPVTSRKCGFPTVVETVFSADQTAKARFRQQMLFRKTTAQDTLRSPSGHFLIHYSTSGIDSISSYDRDSNGIPDYLEFVAESFDRAWFVEIDSLGFNPPPDENGNPLTTYPVFCGRIPFYGITEFYEPIPNQPAGIFRYTSQITINTNFSFVEYPLITSDPIVRDSLAIAVTAAHEFNHALQLGYQIWFDQSNNFTDLWFIESSATYMEEVAANEVNDYLQYLNAYYSSTDQHLARNSGDRIYGTVLLSIMLGEHYQDRGITREVWEEIVNQPALPALDKVLQDKGSDITTEIERLSAWMFFTGGNSIPGRYFPDADLFPQPNLITTDPVSLSAAPNQEVHTGTLPALSFRYLQIPVSGTGGANVLIAPQDHSEWWSGTSFNFSDPYTSEFPAKVYSPTPFLPPATDLFLAVSSGNWETENITAQTTYEVWLQATGGTATDGVLVYPNVIKPGQNVEQITFLNLPDEAEIHIFTGNGLHLITIRPQSSAKIAFWDMQTAQNKAVTSGVYIYRVVAPGKSESGKILIVR